MGLTTGKVLDFETKTKTCRICKNAMKAGKKANVHDCRLNHSASSKTMEPQAAVDLFTGSLKSNVKLSVYTGDDDSTTAAHMKQKVPYPVENGLTLYMQNDPYPQGLTIWHKGENLQIHQFFRKE